ncbi:hypothetical protein GT23_1460 [Parageobacillus thermoglucosidasius]|nr:hypothetical protein GT23_1460 [Parageobacillus thermoglucosidasius]
MSILFYQFSKNKYLSFDQTSAISLSSEKGWKCRNGLR